MGIGPYALGGLLAVAGARGGGEDPARAAHVLRRAAYGPTPAEMGAVRELGVRAWIELQLAPTSLPESERLEALLEGIPRAESQAGPALFDDFVRAQLARALYSPAQLVEQLVLFWEYHFNTKFHYLPEWLESEAAAVYFEAREIDRFRAHALGRFEDLLVTSATGPPMLVFLDGVLNRAGAPNENYARELLELHTVGVRGGYTERDVEEIARCFTGWSVCRVPPEHVGDPLFEHDHELDEYGRCLAEGLWSFRFDAARHDPGSKVLFRKTPWELRLPARAGSAGLRDGYDVLRHLAGLPQTADFVSSKLIAKFVCDAPPPDLVRACRQRWLETGGDLKAVMRVILTSPAFLDDPHMRWNKVRTPIESLCAAVRAFDGRAELEGLDSVRACAETLGQKLFDYPTPEGFPEGASDQLGTTAMLHESVLTQLLYSDVPTGIRFRWSALLDEAGVAPTDAGQVVDHFLGYLFPGAAGAVERQRALAFLSTDLEGRPAPLDPAREDYRSRLALFAAYLSTLPRSALQ